MKIHENQTKNAKRKATCGYCGEEGHNQYSCKHVEADWVFLSKLQVPMDQDGNPIRRGKNYVTWHRGDFDPITANLYSNGVVSWFNNCRKTLVEQRKRAVESKVKAKPKTRTCGFCGSTNLTRRNCPTMKQFLEDCGKANENWRRACYHEVVQKYGLSEGAVVKVKVKEGWNDERVKLGIVKSMSWDTVNVLSSCTARSDFAHSPLTIQVQIGNKVHRVHELQETFGCIGKNGSDYGWWGEFCTLVSVVTHSPTPLDPEWITSYKESFATLVKKRTLDQLKNGMASEYGAPNIVSTVQAWK